MTFEEKLYKRLDKFTDAEWNKKRGGSISEIQKYMLSDMDVDDMRYWIEEAATVFHELLNGELK